MPSPAVSMPLLLQDDGQENHGKLGVEKTYGVLVMLRR